MRYLLPFLAFVTFITPLRSGDKEKKPEHALVATSGQVTGFSMRGGTHEFRLQGPSRDDSIYVQTPVKTSPGAMASRQVLGARGKLGVVKMVVGFAGKSEITTNALLVEAAQAEIVGDKNAADYPPKGKSWVIGKLVEGKFELEKGATATLAILNGDQPVILTGKLADIDPKAGRVKAEGVLRVLRDGRFHLDVERVEAVKEK